MERTVGLEPVLVIWNMKRVHRVGACHPRTWQVEGQDWGAQDGSQAWEGRVGGRQQGQAGEGRMGGRMRGQAWRSKLGWFPPSIRYTRKVGKESGY